MITIIVATDETGGIGKDNEMPWNIHEEMAVFKEHTKGKTVVMGSNTFRSIGSKPLKGRHNIIITRDPNIDVKPHSNENTSYHVSPINADTPLFTAISKDEFVVMGGAMLYRAFMPYASKVIKSTVRGSYDCDTFFPAIFKVYNEFSSVHASPWRIRTLYDNDKFVTHEFTRELTFPRIHL